MTERELRVGDVYLEPDGWGRVLVAANTSGTSGGKVVSWCNLRQTSLFNGHDYRPMSKVVVPKDWVFLFNLGDLFHDATKEE